MNAQERDPAFEGLLEFLRDQRGFDFTGYKRPSLVRRITKRMQDARFEGGFDEYRTYLSDHQDEFTHLFDTILINVTSFFRDAPTWEYVEQEIIPRVVAAREGDPIRIWSTGCSSGEEAYTLAIVFAEALGEEDLKQRVKIYATDVDEPALNSGRTATYTPSQLEPVPPPLREKYFEPNNGGMFAFRPELRRSVIFGRHDLVQDPPISRIDLLVSRNTLMYFDVEAQKRILENFHFALRDDGFLFLGKSEVLVARSPLYSAVDLRRRVFAKVPRPDARERPAVRLRSTDESEEPGDVVERAENVRIAGFETAPTAQIVVDRSSRVVAANMQARVLFSLSQRDVGSLLQDLEISYRPVELRSRIDQAYAEGHTVTLRDVEWHNGAEVRFLDVLVHPLTSTSGETIGVSVSFADVTRYRRLGDALQESKKEIEVAYEELQSTVEELETTNEELQSTNEELETINDELQQRTDELNDVNSFLEAVLGSLAAAVVVVDRELRVQAWNDAARELWGLRPDEVQGEHLLNLDIGLPVDKLRQPIRATLAGDGAGTVTLDAVNRRGKPVRIALRFAPLAGDGSDVRGAIVMMEATDG